MQTTAKKTVRFDPVVRGVAVLSIYDYTPREAALSWYNEDDMSRITKRCCTILKKMERGETTNKTYCIRGLEGHTQVGSIIKKNAVSAAIAAVLLEQSKQRIENKVDEQIIANVYRRKTSICRMRAIARGKRDREIVKVVLPKKDTPHKQGS